MSVVSESTVQPLYKPDPAAMQAHVEHLFGGWLPGCQDGLVELAWTETVPDASGRYKLSHAQLYGTDRLDDLVAEAARLNATPFCNTYIGAALRHPHTPPFGRTSDEDAWALTVLYTDLDEADAFDNAKNVYGDSKPTLVVLTGLHPHGRAQLWWRLDEPLTDSSAWSAQLRGIAAAMNGDPSVTNPARVMRLAGSIAWPVKPGRVVEVTGISPLKKPGPPIYMPEHLALVFPPDALGSADVVSTAAQTADPQTTGTLGLLPAKLDDGRLAYMLRTVLACMVEFIGTHGTIPTPQELFDAAWPQYQRKVDLKSRPGRGSDEFAEKCRYTLKRFEQGKIKKLRTFDEAVAAYKTKRLAWDAAPQSAREERYRTINPTTPPADVSRFNFETTADLRKLPPVRYLIDGWVPAGATGILYGKWGAGKSFLAFDQALHLAYGMDAWHGARLPESGCDVLVIAREGHQGFVGRIDAFKAKYGILDDTDRLIFMRASVSFMRDEDFGGLCEALRKHKRKFQFVVIDTVARVLPGADMNEGKVVTLFMERCALISEISGAAAVGVHHQNKSGTMMGSIYFEANADFVFEVSRLGEEDGPLREGEIVCTKMKDGEDRWKRQVHFEQVQYSVTGSSLVVGSVNDARAKQESWLPPREVCEQMLRVIGEAWNFGQPFSHKFQARVNGKYAQRMLSRQFNLRADVIEKLIISWLDNDVLSFEMSDRKTKKMGLKVIGDIR